MGWILLILLFAVCYAIGWGITALLGKKKNRIWWTFIFGWAAWALFFLAYWPFVVIGCEESIYASDMKLTVDYALFSSLVVSFQHILFVASLGVLLVKNRKSKHIKAIK